MNWTARLACAALAASLPFLLAGPLAHIPAPARLVLATLALILLPGHAILRLIGARVPGGAWFAPGWALPLGVAWLAAVVMATRVAGLPVLAALPWAGAVGAVGWLLPAPSDRAEAEREPPRDAAPWAVALVAVACALAALHCARLGAPVSTYTDSPDHIGTIRRILATGDAFPVDAFFIDAGTQGADPRKGLWHPSVALLAAASGVDPLPVWQWLSAVLAPLFVVNAAILAFLLAGSAGAAIGGWALLLTYGGSLGTQYLREAVFATKLADQLALALLAAVLADLARPSPRARLAAVVIGLGAVAAHVFVAIQAAITFGALGVGLLLRDRGFSAPVRRLCVTAMAFAASALPYLLWRARLSYAPSNVIHLEPQGLFELGGGATIVGPGVLWDWMGGLWIIFPLLWPVCWRERSRPAALVLLTTSAAVALLIFNPIAVAVLQPRLGYLLMRFVWILPVALAVALLLTDAAARWRTGRWRARAAAVLRVAVLAFVLRAPIADAAQVLRDPSAWVERDEKGTVMRWGDALAWMDANLPPRSVILSDPSTAYSVPMMTRHYVSTLVDQHSSPNDSLALDRILDARDALDPHAPWSRTREVVRRWQVTHLVLNDRFAEVPRLDYWAASPQWFRAARVRLDAHPQVFEPVHDTGDFVVYAIHPAALDTLAAAVPLRSSLRPFDAADAAAAVDVGRDLQITDFAIEPGSASPGDTLRVRLGWHATRAVPAGQYDAFVRFERRLPDGIQLPWVLAKPGRKLLEVANGERYRFRWDHNPTHGDFGVDRWRPGMVIRDSFAIAVPPDVASGDWQVQLKIARQPHYPNYHIRDYFSDVDYYSGVPVDSIRIVPRTTLGGR